jgi:hypothetical protein
MSTLSRQSSTVIGAKKQNVAGELYLRPCKDAKTYYRVRLLGFSSKSGRDDPHITRYVHSTWETDPSTGKKRLVKVVCPKTPWVNVEGNRENCCKICGHSDQQFSIYKASGNSDVNARSKAYGSRRSFEAIIPVYVITDPNYEKNAGKFKVIIMNDAKEYAAFREKINAQCRIASPFNGKNAVDCVIHVGSNPITKKDGTIYNAAVIDKIKFTTEPYDLPAINSQTIDAFPFDDTFFVSPDPEEIDEYYNKYCAISNNDIPDDDDIPVYTSDSKPKTTSYTVPTNVEQPKHTDDIPTDDIDELIGNNTKEETKPTEMINELASDPDEEGLVEAVAVKKPSDDINSDDILAELGI